MRVGPGGGGGEMAFGAVYEYKDSRGKPQFVGATGTVPEAQWKDDYGRNQAVRSLAGSGGSASVVWAGVGCGPCGPNEIAAARDAVCRDRAQRQQINELSGAKPYSRHSHLLTFDR